MSSFDIEIGGTQIPQNMSGKFFLGTMKKCGYTFTQIQFESSDGTRYPASEPFSIPTDIKEFYKITLWLVKIIQEANEGLETFGRLFPTKEKTNPDEVLNEVLTKLHPNHPLNTNPTGLN